MKKNQLSLRILRNFKKKLIQVEGNDEEDESKTLEEPQSYSWSVRSSSMHSVEPKTLKYALKSQ